MAEKMASRGLGNSGAMGMGAGDIYSDTAGQLASAYQDWRSQGINEMRGALAPFIEESNAEKLMQLSTEEKKKLIEAQRESIMKQLFGSDYDPTEGSAEYELMAGLAGKGEPGYEMQTAIDKWMREKNPEMFNSSPQEIQNNADFEKLRQWYRDVMDQEIYIKDGKVYTY
jgi:hypothetical protein